MNAEADLELMDRIYPEINKAKSRILGHIDSRRLETMIEALRALVETSERA